MGGWGGGEEEGGDGEEGEWIRAMNQPLQLDGKDSVAPSNQQLKYICHQCGHQTTHSLLLMKERNLPLHSSFDTINLAVNQTRRRRKRRRRRYLTLRKLTMTYKRVTYNSLSG